ncbi:hypothetical protein [Parafrankia sp. EUN1f]|uniref:hypothetical protein n=1 Tax=Parafrankia sp. EUN1f TaxID=102897 RepID=UPI0001C46D44|nr:hypothetical protein [Parafrankia sp. EUN1f]EFC79966.1 hypothetical protein FrEUN1fDRAFT_6920 [Parafrankia sp. EUN1f]
MTVGRVLPRAFATGGVVGVAVLGAGWPYLHGAPALAVVNVLISGGLATAGTALMASAPTRRAGVPLLGAGVAWVATWAMSWNHTLLPLLGIAGNCSFYLLFGVGLLGYPHGRLSGLADRVFVALAGLAFGPLMAVSVLTSRPEWNGYGPDVWWPGWFADLPTFQTISDAYQVVNPLLACGFAIGLVRRVRVLRGPERAAAPLVLGAVAVAGIGVALVAPPIDVDDLDGVMRGIEAQSVVLALLPVALGIAAARRALGVATAADRVLRLADPATIASVRDALRTVLNDPTVELRFWLPDLQRYVDVDGRRAGLDAGVEAGARWTREVRTRDGAPLAVVTGDPALGQHGAFTGAALRAGRLALENAQLQVAVRARLVETHAAHLRVAGARAAQRQRLAHDLGDGMQQRLLDLAHVAAGAPAADPAQTRLVLRHLHEGLLAANQEVRDLGRGLRAGDPAPGGPTS